MEIIQYLISPIIALILAPLLFGVINKTKAFFAGRKGYPILQLYYDLFKFFKKDSVISEITTNIFKISPVIVFGTILAAITVLPFISTFPGKGFTGDFVLIFYLLALGRFFLVLSALDTASSFEGMGASREVLFSALAEPIIFILILSILRVNHTTSLITAFAGMTDRNWVVVMLAAIPMFIVMLTENSRIPFDDPNTHLELTMIHEVMILDNSGVELGLFEYASSLKLWLFSLIFVKIISPFNGAGIVMEVSTTLLLMFLTAVLVGIVESLIARSSLLKVPQLLYSAGIIACLGFFISITNLLQR